MNICIVIPARYGSTRFPGKPLVPIAGIPMLLRVHNLARLAARHYGNVRILVATDHDDILRFSESHGIQAVMTPPECPSGSDRVLAALDRAGLVPDVVVNLQGDNPACPPWFLSALVDAFAARPDAAVFTPCERLTWAALDRLREAKKTTPFSGTFAEFVADGRTENNLETGFALTFSKREIPLLRNEAELRAAEPEQSPVYRHVGLYAYRLAALRAFASWPAGRLERLEGLEQLRFLENGIPVRLVVVDSRGRPPMTGVDAPADVARAEAFFRDYGEYE